MPKGRVGKEPKVEQLSSAAHQQRHRIDRLSSPKVEQLSSAAHRRFGVATFS